MLKSQCISMILKLFSLVFFLSPSLAAGSGSFDPEAIQKKGEYLKERIRKQREEDREKAGWVRRIREENLKSQQRGGKVSQIPEDFLAAEARYQEIKDSECFNNHIENELNSGIKHVCEVGRALKVCSDAHFSIEERKTISKKKWEQIRLESSSDEGNDAAIATAKDVVVNAKALQTLLVDDIEASISGFQQCESILSETIYSDKCLNLYDSVVTEGVIDLVSRKCTEDSINDAINLYITEITEISKVDELVVEARKNYESSRISAIHMGETLLQVNGLIKNLERIANGDFRAPATSERPKLRSTPPTKGDARKIPTS